MNCVIYGSFWLNSLDFFISFQELFKNLDTDKFSLDLRMIFEQFKVNSSDPVAFIGKTNLVIIALSI